VFGSDQNNGRVNEWSSYGGDPGGTRYSGLNQINRTNVVNLKIAWVYHSGDVSDGTRYPRKSAFECTPIFVDGTLYLTTAFNRVVALDPGCGKERWAFDPKINLAEIGPLPMDGNDVVRQTATYFANLKRDVAP